MLFIFGADPDYSTLWEEGGGARAEAERHCDVVQVGFLVVKTILFINRVSDNCSLLEFCPRAVQVVVGVEVFLRGGLLCQSTQARLLFFPLVIFFEVGSISSIFYEDKSLAQFCHPCFPMCSVLQGGIHCSRTNSNLLRASIPFFPAAGL